jgi:hypothetical protein
MPDRLALSSVEAGCPLSKMRKVELRRAAATVSDDRPAITLAIRRSFSIVGRF